MYRCTITAAGSEQGTTTTTETVTTTETAPASPASPDPASDPPDVPRIGRSTEQQCTLPGKLGKDELSVADDPRIMAKSMAEWLVAAGLGGDGSLQELPPH